ncbi:hypothetical protein [Desulfotomaculum sp. 1211_IL3151]|uniref:hypothetical protein n=1 Tax=Desulfotomaculum sp. 1211_IL3151 TaxID=3084055 RepID=UPI002FDA12DC
MASSKRNSRLTAEIVRTAIMSHYGLMSVRFHHVLMKRGVIEFPSPEEIPDKDRRILHKMSVKPFGESIGNFSGLAEFAAEEVIE